MGLFIVHFHTPYHRVMNQFKAAREGNLDQLRAALTLDNIDDVENGGLTALYFAAWYGYVECAKLCVEMHANVNARDDTGHTSLHYATSYGTLGVVRVLLDAGAIVDVTVVSGWTPRYDAIRYTHFDIIRLLIDRGGKVSTVKLDKFVPAIPDWIASFIASRSNCRSVAIVLVGIHKHHRTNITVDNDINVLQLIGKHIWSTRMDGVWSQSQ
jgi:ankyrin repeat protein